MANSCTHTQELHLARPRRIVAQCSAMSDARLEELWEHLRSGHHAALVGTAMPAVPDDVRLIRVSCDVPPSTLGPLHDARRRLEASLGEAPILGQARDRVIGGLRRHLLGESPTTEIDAVLVNLGNRLADLGGGRTVLVFEAAEAADAPTLAILRQIFLRPGWMRLPILLVFRAREPAGAAGALVAALLRFEGASAVIQAGQEESSAAPEADADCLRGLGQGPLTALRAGAVIGTGFEVELCAALLEVSPLTLLLRLQAAVDHGVPLEDRGEGRVHLPATIVEALRAGTSPSLARYWHRRLAELLGGEPRATGPAQAEIDARAGDAALLRAAESESQRGSATPDVATSEAPGEPVAAPDESASAVTSETPASASPQSPQSPIVGDTLAAAANAEGHAPAAVDEAPVGALLATLHGADAAPAVVDAPIREHGGLEEAHAHASPATPHVSHRHRRPPRSEPSSPEDGGGGPWTYEPTPTPTPKPTPTPTPKMFERSDAPPRPREHASHRHRRSHDAARAASHLSALDEGDEAAARYVEAAREAGEAGHGVQGLGHGRRALAILERLAPSEPRRRLRIAALVELARIEWRTVGEDVHLTLGTALGTARQAQEALRPGDPPALLAEVALVIAGIGHDRGDLRALEEALVALVAASKALMAAGDARGAASLLNDQAAIHIRIGDHVQATHLLMRSRQVFEAAGDDDPVALRELGETHLLLAQVPLHAPIRPGREADALSIALDHALVAEKLLRRLGDARAVARVWETMGRIEIGKRRLERAGQRLTAALEVQRGLGDAMGMARTTAALADLLAESGQLRESLGVLAASIGLNREKGSPLGLGLNRQALQRLRPRLRGPEDEAAFAGVEAMLAGAEALLGRHPLPEGVDGPA